VTENIDYLFKLVILGEAAVGKTSLVGRFVYDSFEGDYLATIGARIHGRRVQVEDEVLDKMIQVEDDVLVKLVIWDIAKQTEHVLLRKAYYHNARGAFFVFDTTRPDTIERVDKWIDALYGVTGPIPLLLLENKVDLETAISKENIKKLVDKYKVDLIRTSAKEDTNVKEAFKKMAKELLRVARQRYWQKRYAP
jgi:small GTP-binding protein